MGENNYYCLRTQAGQILWHLSLYKRPTNTPDNGSYQMFCCFHCHPQRSLCYTAQPAPAVSDPKCSQIMQSDMKEIVENKYTTVFFKEMPVLQRQPKEDELKTATTYLLYSWILWRFHEGYYNKFKWSEIGIWIWKFPTKGVCYHHKYRLEFTYQNPRTLSFLMMPTPTHFHTFKHTSLMNPSQNPLFTFMSSFRTSAQTKM